MLMRFVAVYAQARTATKLELNVLSRDLIKTLGGHPELLKLIKECPKGGEGFVVEIVDVLSSTKGSAPSPQLIRAVQNIYFSKSPGAGRDVRVLLPILEHLSNQVLTDILPSIL